MKRLLALSLLANGLLAILLALRPGYPVAKEYPRTPRMKLEAIRRAAQVGPAQTGRIRPAPWEWIEARDPQQVIANLRAVGCPEQTIRDLITLRVCRQHHQRLLAAHAEAFGSWDYTRNRSAHDNQVLQQKQSELRAAMQTELEHLLGAPAGDLQSAILGWPSWGSQYDFLSMEKREKVREINLRYDAAIGEARMGLLPWEPDPETDAQVAELRKQKQLELARVLTAEELKALKLRDSPAAAYARKNLPQAKSAEEFARMVEAVESVGIDDSISAPFQPRRNTIEQTSWEKKQAELAAKLNELLGDDRVRQQQEEEQARKAAETERRSAEQEAQKKAMLAELGGSVGLGAEDMERFYNRLKEREPAIDKKIEELSKSLAGTADAEKTMRAAIKQELEQVAVEVLGDKGHALVQKWAEESEKKAAER